MEIISCDSQPKEKKKSRKLKAKGETKMTRQITAAAAVRKMKNASVEEQTKKKSKDMEEATNAVNRSVGKQKQKKKKKKKKKKKVQLATTSTKDDQLVVVSEVRKVDKYDSTNKAITDVEDPSSPPELPSTTPHESSSAGPFRKKKLFIILSLLVLLLLIVVLVTVLSVMIPKKSKENEDEMSNNFENKNETIFSTPAPSPSPPPYSNNSRPEYGFVSLANLPEATLLSQVSSCDDCEEEFIITSGFSEDYSRTMPSHIQPCQQPLDNPPRHQFLRISSNGKLFFWDSLDGHSAEIQVVSTTDLNPSKNGEVWLWLLQGDQHGNNTRVIVSWENVAMENGDGFLLDGNTTFINAQVTIDIINAPTDNNDNNNSNFIGTINIKICWGEGYTGEDVRFTSGVTDSVTEEFYPVDVMNGFESTTGLSHPGFWPSNTCQQFLIEMYQMQKWQLLGNIENAAGSSINPSRRHGFAMTTNGQEIFMLTSNKIGHSFYFNSADGEWISRSDKSIARLDTIPWENDPYQGPATIVLDNSFIKDVTMSGDGLTLAISGQFYVDLDSWPFNYQFYRVYLWKRQNLDQSWELVGGKPIDGESQSDEFGTRIILSNDGKKLAVLVGGSYRNIVPFIRVYTITDDGWEIYGRDVGLPVPASPSEWFQLTGFAFSGDGSTIATGQSGYTGSVFIWHDIGNGEWVEKADTVVSDIAGREDGRSDGFGGAIALSENGEFMIVGAPQNDPGVVGLANKYPGYAKVYQFGSSNRKYTQIGQDLSCGRRDGRCGDAVAISHDGRRVAIEDTVDSQNIRIFTFDDEEGSWVQLGKDICVDGARSLESGLPLYLSEDGNIVGFGRLEWIEGYSWGVQVWQWE